MAGRMSAFAGDPSRGAGGDRGAGVGGGGSSAGGHLDERPGRCLNLCLELGGLGGGEDLFEGHGDHDGRCDLAGEFVGVEVLDQVGQGPAAALRPVHRRPIRIPTRQPGSIHAGG